MEHDPEAKISDDSAYQKRKRNPKETKTKSLDGDSASPAIYKVSRDKFDPFLQILEDMPVDEHYNSEVLLEQHR